MCRICLNDSVIDELWTFCDIYVAIRERVPLGFMLKLTPPPKTIGPNATTCDICLVIALKSEMLTDRRTLQLNGAMGCIFCLKTVNK